MSQREFATETIVTLWVHPSSHQAETNAKSIEVAYAGIPIRQCSRGHPSSGDYILSTYSAQAVVNK